MTVNHRHLAIYIYGLTGGGATRRTLTLAEGFAARGHRVDLVVVSAKGPLMRELPRRVRLVALDSPAVRTAAHIKWRRRRKQILVSVAALARYLRRERPDVLMSAANHVHMSAVWARRLAGVSIPLVLRVSNHLTHSHLSETRRQRPMRLWLARRLYGWADAAIGVSRGISEDLAQHTAIPKARIITIYNPTFTAESLHKAASPLEHPWLTPDSPPVILGAGRLTTQKDFPTLLRAFARIRKRCPARLVILGEGKSRPALIDLATDLGIVQEMMLPGFVDNPFAWMSRSAVFVLSSVWEGFPGVLIEAMACGCPVVSTDCPSGPAEILNGDEYGPLVSMGDDKALAEAVLNTLQEPLDPAKLRARAAEYSVDRALDRYLEVLLGMC